MRKRKYRLHYGDYAPEENERLYMDMSKKGWRLAKRGIFFSRFVRTEPEDLLYRIDFSAPHSSEKYNLLIDTMYSCPASLSAAFLLDGRRRFLLCRMGCTIAERMD